MRICFIVPWITKGRGGTENVGQMMANAMASRGHAVHIITFDDAAGLSRWPLSEKITLSHVCEGAGPNQDGQLLMALASVQPDLVVGLHMNRTFLSYVRAALKLGLPLVLSEHQDPRFPARIGTFDPHERLVAFQGATRLHLLTDSFLDTLPAHLRARARVIPNTVPPTSNIADPGGNAKHAKVLLAVARLVERKNLRRLLHEFAKVAPRHPDWILRIVGGGPLREDLESLARQLDLGAQVSFTGEINDVYGALAKAQCFVLPSLFEGFPMSSLEAMAHGLPVIGYAACNGLNTQVKHELNGLLAAPALASDSLSRELDRVMSNAKLRRNMGTASLERYRTLYSNEAVFDQWEALFMEAADQPRHSRIPLEDRLEAALDRAVFGDF